MALPTLAEIVAIVLEKLLPVAKAEAAERGIPESATEEIVQIIETKLAEINLVNLPAELVAAAREALEKGKSPIALSDTDTA